MPSLKKRLTALVLPLLVAACAPMDAPTLIPTLMVPPPTQPAPTATPEPTTTSPAPTPTQPPPTATPRPTTTPLAPTPTSTLPPKPTDAPKTPTGGVSAAQLLNAQQGWALQKAKLFWTADTGQHWQPVNPGFAENQSLQNAFYLDAQQAWVLICETQAADTVFKIAHTTDAWRTSATSEVVAVNELIQYPDNTWCHRGDTGQVFFLNAQQGWLLLEATLSMNSRTGVMFQTLDGGQTWQRLGFDAPSGEFRFVSATTGWMRATCCTGGPWELYRTVDGGATWAAAPISSANGNDDDFFLPIFPSAGLGLLAAIVRENGLPQAGITFFDSADAGTTWTPSDTLPVVYDGLGIGGVTDVQMLSAETWAVALPGNGVYWTTDGGQHWIENQTASTIQHLSLGSATVGWGLACQSGAAPDCVRLMVTTDSGAHWAEVPIAP